MAVIRNPEDLKGRSPEQLEDNLSEINKKLIAKENKVKQHPAKIISYFRELGFVMASEAGNADKETVKTGLLLAANLEMIFSLEMLERQAQYVLLQRIQNKNNGFDTIPSIEPVKNPEKGLNKANMLKDIENRRSDARTGFRDKYPELDHSLPNFFFECVEKILGLAKQYEDVDNDQMAYGLALGANLVLESTEKTYKETGFFEYYKVLGH